MNIIILFILAITGTSETVFGFLKVMLIIVRVLVIIMGIVHTLACLLSGRKIFTKILNTICIILFSYSLYWGAGSFRDELAQLFDQNTFRYIIAVIFGGIEFLIYMFAGSFAVVSMSSEDADTPHYSIISGVIFYCMMTCLNPTLIPNIIVKLGNVGMITLKVILLISFVISIIQFAGDRKKS